MQIFSVFQTCNYLPISIIFTIQQGALAVLMAVIAKYVYRMVGAHVGKKKISNILSNDKGKDKDMTKSKKSKSKAKV